MQPVAAKQKHTTSHRLYNRHKHTPDTHTQDEDTAAPTESVEKLSGTRSVFKEMERSRSLSQNFSGSESDASGFFGKGITVVCEGLKRSTDINGKRGIVLGRQKMGEHLLVQVSFDERQMAVKEAYLRPVCAAEQCERAPATKCANCTLHYCLKCTCKCAERQAEKAQQWVDDSAATACSGCGEAFNLTRRRHHCRACGHLFCSSCVNQRQHIPGFTSPQKVCQGCCTSIAPSTKNWVPDSECDECTLCWADFTKSRRRHHCRACGKIYCDGCSSQRMKVQGYVLPQRVCTRCAVRRTSGGGATAMPMTAPKFAVPSGYESTTLRVTLLMALSVPKMELIGSNDVFVRCRARTNRDKWVGEEVTWPVVFSTNEPHWHITREFGCLMADVSALEFRLWNSSSVGDAQYIGDATTPLASLKLGKPVQLPVHCKGKGTALVVTLPAHPPTIKQVFFVRHGQSRWNAAKAAGGSAGVVDRLKETDHPLSAVGCEQAVDLCSQVERALQQKEEGGSLGALFQGIEQVYASPLTRATQTAVIGVNPIIRNTAKKLVLTRYAREKRNVGGRDTTGGVRGEGIVKRVRAEVEQLFDGEVPNVVDCDSIDASQVDLRWWNDSAESKEEFSERLRELTNLIKWSPHKSLMIVGHSHCFRGLVNLLISPKAQLPPGVSFSDLQHKKLSNCGMMHAVIDFSQPHPIIKCELCLDTTLVGKVKKKGDAAKAGSADEEDEEDDEDEM